MTETIVRAASSIFHESAPATANDALDRDRKLQMLNQRENLNEGFSRMNLPHNQPAAEIVRAAAQ